MSDQSNQGDERLTATDEADSGQTQQAGLREPARTTASAPATNAEQADETEGIPVGGDVDGETAEEGRDVGSAGGAGIESDLTTPVDRPRDSTRGEQPPSAPRATQQAAAEAE